MVGLIMDVSVFEVIKSVKGMSIDEIVQVNPDLVVIDYLLEDGYGDQLCATIKSNPLTHHIPVILFSACFSLEQISNQCGANSFISKPFDIYDFEEKVKELIL